MQKQDERAVETMIKCGLSLEAVFDSFPQFDKSEIKELFNKEKNIVSSYDSTRIKVNCS